MDGSWEKGNIWLSFSSCRGNLSRSVAANCLWSGRSHGENCAFSSCVCGDDISPRSVLSYCVFETVSPAGAPLPCF